MPGIFATAMRKVTQRLTGWNSPGVNDGCGPSSLEIVQLKIQLLPLLGQAVGSRGEEYWVAAELAEQTVSQGGVIGGP